MTELPDSDQPPTTFVGALNRQGFAFQYAALKAAHDHFDSRKSAWYFEVSEFPVGVSGKDTRIDFILRRNKSPLLLCVECKRADPRTKHWCFVQAPYVHRNASYNKVTADQLLQRANGDWTTRAVEVQGLRGFPICHIGLQIRSGKAEGEDERGRPLAADEAVGQACKGANGLIEFLHKNPSCIGEHKSAVVLPAVFTTAQLWTSDAKLDHADCATGEVDVASGSLERCDFLIYQYHLPTGIKHTATRETRFRDLADALASDYIRSVAVVSASGIDKFLQQYNPDSFDLEPIIRVPKDTYVE